VAELDFPPLAYYSTPSQSMSDTFAEPCGQGPPIRLDGTIYQTSLQGSVGDLVALNPVNLSVCSPKGSVAIGAGTHRLTAPTSVSPFNVSSLTIAEVGSTTNLTSPARSAAVLSWAPETRSVKVSGGPATYLEIHQNYGPAWTASLNGKALTPVTLDGWQQGYFVPAGGGGIIRLNFGPEGTYRTGLLVGAFAAMLLVLLAVGMVLSRRGAKALAAPPWSSRVPLWLSIGLTMGVILVIGSPLALVVPGLLIISWRWRTLIPWVAAAAMLVAGAIAAWHPGNGAGGGVGSFSAAAQACALVALAAVLLPSVERSPRRRSRRLTMPVAGLQRERYVQSIDLDPVIEGKR